MSQGTKINLQTNCLQGDTLHIVTGGSGGFDTGLKAYYTNADMVTVGNIITSVRYPSPDLDFLSFEISDADEFDHLVASGSNSITFSNGLTPGSKVYLVQQGTNYLVGEVHKSSTHSKVKIALEANTGIDYLGDVVRAIQYQNTATDPAYQAQRQIAVRLQTKEGVATEATINVKVTSGPITFYDRNDDHIIGSDRDDIFNLEHLNINGSNNDVIDGRGGYDTLNINTPYVSDIGAVKNVEKINGAIGFDNFTLSYEEYLSLDAIDLRDGGTFTIHGETSSLNIDMRGKTFANVDILNVGVRPDYTIKPGSGQFEFAYGKCTITTDNVNHAKMVNFSTLGTAELVLTQGVLSTADRAMIYSHNITQITSAETPAFKDSFGNAKKNTLRGNAESNVLDGGSGSDTLYGMGGKDIFMFGDKLGKNNVDRIKDFKHKVDLIQLDHDIFKVLKAGALAKSAFHLGTKATNKKEHILFDEKTGKLYFDEDGSGRKAAVEFAVLESKHKAISYVDFYVV